jgi:hypothetical protein
MAKTKYLLTAALAAALAGPAFAQESPTTTGADWSGRDMTYRGESYDVLDSSYVPARKLDQHREYLNHQTAFPAKPRNMWEIGVSGGLYNVSGDVPSLFLWQNGGFGLGAHVRKALGYVGSLRLDYNYGVGKGLSWQPAAGYNLNPAWNGANHGLTTGQGVYGGKPVFYNYKMESHQLNADVVVSLGNILFHKSRTKIDPYIFGGVGANAYQTWVNSLNENFQAYDFNSIIAKYPNGIGHAKRRDVRDDLKDLLDDSYETDAETLDEIRRPSIFGKKTLSFVTSFGAGVAFRLTPRVNLAIEDRVTLFPTTNEDLLDGQRWAEQVPGSPVLTQSKDGINYLSLGLNVNLGGKDRAVEPLYWLNPLDHAYSELANPRHMILPDPVLPDADGDGITDQFDRCPGTPAGTAVDSHGCPMDTDGDGVPDDRDKELITPTYCQPVDADGVGKCPCCGDGPGTCATKIPGGSLSFSGNSTRLTSGMEGQLATLASMMAANPDCRVVVMGNGAGSKLEQQRSWDRVNAVINHMADRHNIDKTRFIFKYDAGDMVPRGSVMYRAANDGEEGSSNEAPPHPELSGR